MDQNEYARRNTGNPATLAKQIMDQTYITQDDFDPELNGVMVDPNKPRLDSKSSKTRDKTSGGKRVPPGVRLYNQAKNTTKGKAAMKKKEDQPLKPVLTKDVEDMLIQSNREKCEEVVKTSNTIHEILSQAGIDNQSIVDALFADPLFRHVLANLLFNSKILGKNKLESFLESRITTFIKEYNTDKQIKENLYSIHQRIKDKIEKLKNYRKKYFER
jgi:hypothetical protein